MDQFAKTLYKIIMEKEKNKLDKILNYLGDNIEKDMIKATYSAIDNYYKYEPKVYIRTDDYKKNHANDKRKRDKRGKFAKENPRKNDISLMTVLHNEPAMGVNRPIGGIWGHYQAGVIFNPGYFERAMKHSTLGDNFSEWDIAENFLLGFHGQIEIDEDSADMMLSEYINNYKSRFDMHYKNALSLYK